MSKISVHDNFIVSYTVDCAKREIRLRTEYRDREPLKLTDIVFRGVLAYHFEGDNFNSIMFDVEEVEPEQIVKQNRALFEEGQRHCWPGSWNESEASAIQHIKKERLKGFFLRASYGMGGWVLAREMILQRADDVGTTTH